MPLGGWKRRNGVNRARFRKSQFVGEIAHSRTREYPTFSKARSCSNEANPHRVASRHNVAFRHHFPRELCEFARRQVFGALPALRALTVFCSLLRLNPETQQVRRAVACDKSQSRQRRESPHIAGWYHGVSLMKCTGNRLSRRSLLTVGAIGGLGLTLTDFFRLQEAQADERPGATGQASASSVIFIYLPGGMAQQETFDPKPYAPLEYRGPLGSIETRLPGVRLGQYLPRTAQVMDKITVIRSMTHGEAAHERGTHNMFTGYRPSPALQYPSIGSVVSHEFGPRNNLPPYVCIPNQPNEFAGPGYLNDSFAGFSIGGDPARNGFRVRDLQMPGGVDEHRFVKRRRLLEQVNQHFRQRENDPALQAVDTFYERAYSLVSSQAAREAFDIEKEDAATRDAYGRNTAGARMLLARRLVEAGVRFATLTYGGWDMHDNIQQGMQRNVPAFDQGFAALITDLDQRGLLDSTLVCVATEFGRTPKINGTAGRDHWPRVFSIVMAGGGIKRGSVYGKSNATSSEPEEDPLTVENWATTLYHCLGIRAEKELVAPGNRPIEIVNGGQVVEELLA
jgi:hypothetical protein